MVKVWIGLIGETIFSSVGYVYKAKRSGGAGSETKSNDNVWVGEKMNK